MCAVATDPTGGRTGLIHHFTDLTHHLVSGAIKLNALQQGNHHWPDIKLATTKHTHTSIYTQSTIGEYELDIEN